MTDESPFGHGPDIPQGYVRKLCSVCGEGLSYSESDPCERCSDLQNVVIAAAKTWREADAKYHAARTAFYDLEDNPAISDDELAKHHIALMELSQAEYPLRVDLRAAIDSLLLAETDK